MTQIDYTKMQFIEESRKYRNDKYANYLLLQESCINNQIVNDYINYLIQRYWRQLQINKKLEEKYREDLEEYRDEFKECML